MALDLFHEMQQHGVMPNEVTCTSLLTACADLKDLDLGLKIYKMADLQTPQLQTSLLNLYLKCNRLSDAVSLFHSIRQQKLDTVVAWNSVLAMFIKHERYKDGLDLYFEMERANITPNFVTYTCVLTACVPCGVPMLAKQLHCAAINTDQISSVQLQTALLNVYAHFGTYQDARSIFDVIQSQNALNIAVWNAMISACGMDGYGKEALTLYRSMLPAFPPNEITIVSILNACSHTGLVEEGLQIFTSMTQRGLNSNVTALQLCS
jgi:pentatricopeptide repeat protein